MSADNGIYILRTDGPEFRVAHAQAIDQVWIEYDNNDDIDEMPTEWVPDYGLIVHIFGESPVHTTLEKAMLAAQKLHDEYGWTEYGINVVNDFAKYSFTYLKEQAKDGENIRS